MAKTPKSPDNGPDESDPNDDMFGLPSGQPNNDEDGAYEDVHFVILQIIPADGWYAVFNDNTAANGTRTLGIACFALVEVHGDGDAVLRQVRPMVADEEGEIGDVASFEDFICIVPPGREMQPVVDFARQRMANQEGTARPASPRP